jgi:hypothetical protein
LRGIQDDLREIGGPAEAGSRKAGRSDGSLLRLFGGDVLVRGFRELLLVVFAAEVIRLAFVDVLAIRGLRIDGHAANQVDLRRRLFFGLFLGRCRFRIGLFLGSLGTGGEGGKGGDKECVLH